jgi:CheY-like chemotaxis protein
VFLANLLKQRNQQEDTSNNGIQALNLVKISSYDFILIDLSMAKMDGFGAID